MKYNEFYNFVVIVKLLLSSGTVVVKRDVSTVKLCIIGMGHLFMRFKLHLLSQIVGMVSNYSHIKQT